MQSPISNLQSLISNLPLWVWGLALVIVVLLTILLARKMEFVGIELTATPPFFTFQFKRKRAQEPSGLPKSDEAMPAPNVSATGARSVAIGGDVHAPIITGDVHLLPPERPPRGSAAPPARTAHYVHRGKIEDDVRAALQARNTFAVVGVAGMGGIGKTELAKHLCGELERTHRVIWVSVYDRLLADVQNELARALGITFDPRADASSRYDTLRAAFHDNPCIVFFDDVFKAAIPALKFLLPPSPPCAALITSRQRELGVARVIELDVMTEEQALELLREAHGLAETIAREAESAKTLCRLCGYLPLALDIAASRLRKQLHFSATPHRRVQPDLDESLEGIAARQYARSFGQRHREHRAELRCFGRCRSAAFARAGSLCAEWLCAACGNSGVG